VDALAEGIPLVEAPYAALGTAAGLDEAHALLEELAAAGVDYDDVVAVLEAEGVQKFSDSFHSLLDGIRAKRSALTV